MKLKVITITWSYDSSFEIEKTTLYKSFKKFNTNKDLLHFHFNRNLYRDKESDFLSKYGVQSDYLLYKIFLLRDVISNIDADYIIFCDANDVTCIGNIDELLSKFDLEKNLIIGREINQWPTISAKQNWPNYTDYDSYHTQEKKFLNSGVILGSKNIYLEVLNSLIENVMNNEIKTFGGDQGVFTYYYNNNVNSKIKLDELSELVVNTFLRSHNEYELVGNKLKSKSLGTSPVFVHDNGWNHGSPKYLNHFELKRLFVDSYPRLKDISKDRPVPKTHQDYLFKLKNEFGFYPSVIYDIGACVNHWNVIAKEVWPDAKYFLFEAMEESEDIFLEGSDPYEIGVLSDVDGKEVTFYKNVVFPGGNSYYMENPKHSSMAEVLFSSPSNQFKMKTKTLNSVRKKRGFLLPDLIKIDVQGCEIDILKGASEILENVKHLIVELQHVEYNIGATLSHDSIPMIESMGFELVTPKFSTTHVDADYHFIKKRRIKSV